MDTLNLFSTILQSLTCLTEQYQVAYRDASATLDSLSDFKGHAIEDDPPLTKGVKTEPESLSGIFPKIASAVLPGKPGRTIFCCLFACVRLDLVTA